MELLEGQNPQGTHRAAAPCLLDQLAEFGAQIADALETASCAGHHSP